MAFTANPEDYTARGKIITPLKDLIGSEIRTHYAANRQVGMEITGQEAWVDRGGSGDLELPSWVREVVEEIAVRSDRDAAPLRAQPAGGDGDHRPGSMGRPRRQRRSRAALLGAGSRRGDRV